MEQRSQSHIAHIVPRLIAASSRSFSRRAQADEDLNSVTNQSRHLAVLIVTVTSS